METTCVSAFEQMEKLNRDIFMAVFFIIIRSMKFLGACPTSCPLRTCQKWPWQNPCNRNSEDDHPCRPNSVNEGTRPSLSCNIVRNPK